jgi:hypothetical protein
MKGSKARDFRVTIADVTRALAEVDDDDENDSGQPSCKKAKVRVPPGNARPARLSCSHNLT